nr:hypothetical protein [Pseudonocardia acidicola]
MSLVGAAAPDPATPTGAVDPADAGATTALRLTTDASAAEAAVPPLAEQRSLRPVAPATDVLDAAGLVKAVRLAERQAVAEAERKAAAQRAEAERKAAAAKAAAVTGSLGCTLSTAGLGPVKPWVADAAEFLGCLFGRPPMIGVASRGNASDHPSGHALDFMMRGAAGDRLAACALRNKEALGITYVIWKQRINYGSGWETMDDRGGETANHYDHVHISFATSAPGGRPAAC